MCLFAVILYNQYLTTLTVVVYASILFPHLPQTPLLWNAVPLNEADGSRGGIWRIKFRGWRAASRYPRSVVGLLEGCNLSFQKGEVNMNSHVERSQKDSAGWPFLASSGQLHKLLFQVVN